MDDSIRVFDGGEGCAQRVVAWSYGQSKKALVKAPGVRLVENAHTIVRLLAHRGSCYPDRMAAIEIPAPAGFVFSLWTHPGQMLPGRTVLFRLFQETDHPDPDQKWVLVDEWTSSTFHRAFDFENRSDDQVNFALESYYGELGDAALNTEADLKEVSHMRQPPQGPEYDYVELVYQVTEPGGQQMIGKVDLRWVRIPPYSHLHRPNLSMKRHVIKLS
jgi:hypothetical protein